jgi:hypothetical protein
LCPSISRTLVWTFDVQDLSISLASLERFIGSDELRGAFRQGYSRVRGCAGGLTLTQPRWRLSWRRAGCTS